MSVRATSNLNLKKIGKYLFFMVLAFSGCNHCVRQLAYNPPSAPTGLDDWSLFHVGPVIVGMNNTRQGLGRWFGKSVDSCPQSGYAVCKSSLEGIRFGLGLH